MHSLLRLCSTNASGAFGLINEKVSEASISRIIALPLSMN